MASDEKSNPPPSYVEPAAPPYAPPYAPEQVTGYAQQPVQYPLGHPGVVLPAQTTSVAFAGGVPAVNQNVLIVQTVRTNVQIPEVYPGVAFCSFVPGIIETLIRSSVVVR